MNTVTKIFARIERLVRSTDVSVPPAADIAVDSAAAERRPGPDGIRGGAEPGPGHAPGHRHLGPPPDRPEPNVGVIPPARPPAWHEVGGRVGRLRRNERRG